MNSSEIGKFIEELRKKNNMTQAEFGDKLCVTAQAVSKWENGRGIPDISIMQKISKEFNTDVSIFITGKSRENNYFKLIGAFVLIALIIVAVFLINNHSSLSSAPLKSNNALFNVSGVAAFSNKNKLIYISDIEYLNKDNNTDKYVMMECSLYEENEDGDKKISQCGSIDTNKKYTESDSHTLQELLKNINFNTKYTSSCNTLEHSKLYLVVNALDINNKVITYKVPLTLDTDCN